MTQKIAVLNIGDELLNGKVLNTNAFDVSRFVYSYGHTVSIAVAVPDSTEDIILALSLLVQSNNLVIVTGGLGPTQDDITRRAIAEYLGVDIITSRTALKWLSQYLQMRPGLMSAAQKSQVKLPRGCRPLKNSDGTACGFVAKKEQTVLMVLPGVPGELKAMLNQYLATVLRGRTTLLERHVRLWGWSESRQRGAFETIALPDDLRFSSLPSEGGVLLSLSLPLKDKNPSDLSRKEKLLLRYWNQLLDIVPGEYIVDRSGMDIPEKIVSVLSRHSATVATAESCTGGAMAFLITSVPGSSGVFYQGSIAYSNLTKSRQLGVNDRTLKKHGAVSRAVVREMVSGCLERSGADFGVAVSGIAGPGGGTKQKPVGTVFIGAGSKSHIITEELHLIGNREKIRWRSAYAALNLLRKFFKTVYD